MRVCTLFLQPINVLLLLLHQALKANPSLAPKDVKIGSNYITKFGQVALEEALDMVYEMGGQREIVIHF